MAKEEQTVDLILRVYRTIRGLPHHRIATGCVFGGLFVLASPVWEPFVRAFAEWALQTEIPDSPSPWFGIGAIVLGMLYHLAMTKLEQVDRSFKAAEAKERSERYRAHDQEKYGAAFEIMSERSIKGMLDFIDANHLYRRSRVNNFRDFVDFLNDAENQFLLSPVAEEAQKLIKHSDELDNFLGMKFFTHGPLEDDRFFAMQPSWNIDRGGVYDPEKMKKYDALAEELHQHLNNVRNSIDELIATAARELA